MAKLYIIGNGFDLHHWIDSGFDDYGNWLRENYPGLHSQLAAKYAITDEKDWKDFEHLLGELNVEDQVEDIMEERRPNWICMPENDKDFADHIRDYQAAPDEAQYTFEDLYNAVRCSFRKWVKQLNAAESTQKILIDNNDSWFINFNYTDTLETLYQIPQDKIIYIHGSVKTGEKLVLGHGKTRKELLREWGTQITDDDVEAETYTNIIEHLASQRKPVDELIGKLSSLHNEWDNIDFIHIYGFSFSDIDMPYIREITRHIDNKNVKWKVSYFEDIDKEKFVKALVAVGVPRGKIQMVILDQLMIEQEA